jgi:hypothetical protein
MNHIGKNKKPGKAEQALDLADCLQLNSLAEGISAMLNTHPRKHSGPCTQSQTLALKGLKAATNMIS